MIHYVTGDATKADGGNVGGIPLTLAGKRIIAHVCNNMGAWGAGFVVPLGNRYPKAREDYLALTKAKKLRLGSVSYPCVALDVVVANMVAQDGFPSKSHPVALDYKALGECLYDVGEKADEIRATVHMPRIGCGIAGGTWSLVEPLIEAFIHVPVFVYDLPPKRNWVRG